MSRADIVIREATKIAENKTLNALEKLIEIAKASTNLDSSSFKHRIQIIKLFNSPGNLQFSIGLSESIHNRSLPIIESIINQEIKENLFQLDFPVLIADTYLTLSDKFKRKIVDLLIENVEFGINNLLQIEEWIKYNQNIIEKILGLEKGSYALVPTMMAHITKILSTSHTP